MTEVSPPEPPARDVARVVRPAPVDRARVRARFRSYPREEVTGITSSTLILAARPGSPGLAALPPGNV